MAKETPGKFAAWPLVLLTGFSALVFALASWSLWAMVWHSAGAGDAAADLQRMLGEEHGIDLKPVVIDGLVSGYGTLEPAFRGVVMVWAMSLLLLVAGLMLGGIRLRRPGSTTGAEGNRPER